MSQEPSADRFDDITIFTTADGATRVAVRFQNENVWLTQKLMAKLYECSTDNVGLHLKNIFAERELDEKSVTEESSATAADGKSYRMKFYSLEAIIAVPVIISTNGASCDSPGQRPGNRPKHISQP